MTAPVLSGTISSGGAIAILQAIEDRRTSGVLRFKGASIEGDIVLVAGQIALEQNETSSGEDPVEALLAVRDGTYEVYQRLPQLPISRGDDQHRRGSLSVHVPADLMRFSERVGFTGLLLLYGPERAAQLVYDAGELRAIAIDGSTDSDVHEVFGWNEGSFEMIVFAAPPPRNVNALLVPHGTNVLPGRDPTFPRICLRGDGEGEFAYRIDEMRKSLILTEREKRRARERVPGADEVLPPTRESHRPGGSGAPPATVAVVYLGAPGDPRTHSEPSPAAEAALAGSGLAAAATPMPAWLALLQTTAWVVFALTIFLAILALLARMPPVG
jgi:hypothetical protein